MKNFIKIILLLVSVFGLNSCEIEEKNPIPQANGFIVTKDDSVVAPNILTDVINNDIFAKLTWDKSNNGVSSVSSYSLVIFDHENDVNLLNPVEYTGSGVVVTPDSRKASLKVKELNDLINKLNSFKCSEMSIDIRIKSKLGVGPNPFVQYSSPVNYKVTAYPNSKLELAFTKDGNVPKDEPKLLSSAYTTKNDYEAYLYLQAGNYKFVRPDACGSYTSASLLGGTGTLASGVIDASATPASIVIPNTGHYYIKVNLVANTYSISEFTSVGVFGRATRGGTFGFNNVVPMIYDNATKKWSLTMDLFKGQGLKFKTLKWTGPLIMPSAGAPFPKPDYIPSGSTTFSTFGTPSVNVLSDASTTDIKTSGTASLTDTEKYIVEVDISNPRNYKYTLTKI